MTRFIRRVLVSEQVWLLEEGSGVAICQSNEEEDRSVYLFFSDAAYARRARDESFQEFQPEHIDLFGFLYRWLPGMTRDGFLAGPN